MSVKIYNKLPKFSLKAEVTAQTKIKRQLVDMLVIVNVDNPREKEPPNKTELNTNSEQHNDVIATIHIFFFVINQSIKPL